MSDSRTVQALNRLLDPIGKALTPDVARNLVALRADDQAQARMDDLAQRNTEGLLSRDELEEYHALVAAADVIAILQLKAKAILSGNTAA
jgi:hypothetical protein